MDTAHLLGPGEAVLAIDVGGTGISAGLFGPDGAIVGSHRESTTRDLENPAETLVDQARGILQVFRTRFPQVPPAVVGLSVPGIVNEHAGTGVFSSNLGWRNAPLKAFAEQALGLPVAFGHDVRSACLAEYRFGAARGTSDAVILTIGTGIAGGIIVGGEVAVADGYAGEIGHVSLDPNGPPCPCGARGCLEQVASASAIARLYFERSGTAVDGSREVRLLADDGDRIAQAVWNGATDALALALAQLTAFLAPEVIVIGGGLSRAGDSLFVPVRTRLEEWLSFHRVPRVVPAALLDDAGLLGTALQARQYAKEQVTSS